MKFYKFRQNNSSGVFDEEGFLAVEVYIEATDAEEANAKANELGIYFYGCAEGRDCRCCGDRWYRADESSAVEWIAFNPSYPTESFSIIRADGRKSKWNLTK